MLTIPKDRLSEATAGPECQRWAAVWWQTWIGAQMEAIDLWASAARMLTSPRAWMELVRQGVQQWATAAPATWNDCSQLALVHYGTAQALLKPGSWLSRQDAAPTGPQVGLKVWEATQTSLHANTLTTLRIQARHAYAWSSSWALLEPASQERSTGDERPCR